MNLPSRLTSYLRRNWGSPFIVAFVLLLLVSATELSAGISGAADAVAAYSYYCLAAGVVLQIASYVWGGDEESKPGTVPGAKTPRRGVTWSRGRKIAAIATIALLSSALGGYYAVFHPPETRPANSSSSTSCSLNGSGGTVFVSSSVDASITICGRSYSVLHSEGGGLSYAYSPGMLLLTAPASVNGSQFEFWYVVLRGTTPAKSTNTTLVLDLPSGLRAQDSLVEAFYTPRQPAPNATITSETSTSTPSATSNSTLGGLRSSTTSRSSSSSSSSNSRPMTVGCVGGDGSLFVTSSVEASVLMSICGKAVVVDGGVGGGFYFFYRAGNIRLIAPPSTSTGSVFLYWFVVLPSGAEKFTSPRISISLPPGYNAEDAVVEAFYG